MTILAFAAATVFGLLFIHPYVLYPLTLKWRSTAPLDRSAATNLRGTDGHEFALFFCAYNEERSLAEKIQNLRDLKIQYPQLEIRAYDDSSSDATPHMLQQASDILIVHHGPGRTGKAHGMAILANLTQRPFLIFTDANVTLDLDAIGHLQRHFADTDVGGVCGSLRYLQTTGSPTQVAGGAYWKLEEFIKSEESRTGDVMGADGSVFATRKELYPTFPDTVQDDFTVSMHVIFAGLRLVHSKEVVGYERLVESQQEEFGRKVRIAARAFHTHVFLRPSIRRMSWLNQYKYLSHKRLRWSGAAYFVLAVGFCGAYIGLTLGLLGLITVTFACTAALLLLLAFRRELFLLAFEILLAISATYVGMVKGRRGSTFSTWQPPTR